MTQIIVQYLACFEPWLWFISYAFLNVKRFLISNSITRSGACAMIWDFADLRHLWPHQHVAWFNMFCSKYPRWSRSGLGSGSAAGDTMGGGPGSGSGSGSAWRRHKGGSGSGSGSALGSGCGFGGSNAIMVYNTGVLEIFGRWRYHRYTPIIELRYLGEFRNVLWVWHGRNVPSHLCWGFWNPWWKEGRVPVWLHVSGEQACILLHAEPCASHISQTLDIHTWDRGWITLPYLPCTLQHATLHFFILHYVTLPYLTLYTLHYLGWPYLISHCITLYSTYITWHCLPLPYLSLHYLLPNRRKFRKEV